MDKIMEGKGQEEMVGFVLIMVLVAVIFLVFLAFSVRRGATAEQQDSAEVSYFLDMFVEYTTDCSLNDYSYETMSELIRECERGTLCTSGKRACEVLQITSKEIINNSWNFGANSITKNFRFDIFSENNDRKTFLEGFPLGNNCDKTRGADKPIGNGLTVSLELCV